MLIVFEGADGSGLSTQSSMLKEFLEKNHEVLITKEPTENPIGKLIRAVLKKEISISPVALQLLFTADRAQHLKELETEMKRKIVIMDRYILSTLAFGALEVDIGFLKKINSNFPKPDMTFIILTSPEECMKRIDNSRPSRELFEERGKSKKIRDNYMAMKDFYPNIFLINGNHEKGVIFSEIRKIVESRIKI